MAKASLSNMDVGALLDLRRRVDGALAQRRIDLERQLKELGRSVDGASVARGRGVSVLKGNKVAPKYRDPATGATWSGRGAKAGWIVAAIKQGKLNDFLIEKVPAVGKKKRRSKR